LEQARLQQVPRQRLDQLLEHPALLQHLEQQRPQLPVSDLVEQVVLQQVQQPRLALVRQLHRHPLARPLELHLQLLHMVLEVQPIRLQRLVHPLVHQHLEQLVDLLLVQLLAGQILSVEDPPS